MNGWTIDWVTVAVSVTIYWLGFRSGHLAATIAPELNETFRSDAAVIDPYWNDK